MHMLWIVVSCYAFVVDCCGMLWNVVSCYELLWQKTVVVDCYAQKCCDCTEKFDVSSPLK